MMGLMNEREDEGEVDEKLPSSAEGLAGMTVRPWVEDWDEGEIGVGLAGFIGDGFDQNGGVEVARSIGWGHESRTGMW